jgi:hypothetical protein
LFSVGPVGISEAQQGTKKVGLWLVHNFVSIENPIRILYRSRKNDLVVLADSHPSRCDITLVGEARIYTLQKQEILKQRVDK